MELDRRYEDSVGDWIIYLGMFGVNPYGAYVCWDLELSDRPPGHVINDIMTHAYVFGQSVSGVSVLIPLPNIIPLLKKPYVEKASVCPALYL